MVNTNMNFSNILFRKIFDVEKMCTFFRSTHCQWAIEHKSKSEQAAVKLSGVICKMKNSADLEKRR